VHALPPLPVLRERVGVRVIRTSNAAGTRNHPHPSLLPEYREKGPEAFNHKEKYSPERAENFGGSALSDSTSRPMKSAEGSG
jgi:hypothetical protein